MILYVKDAKGNEVFLKDEVVTSFLTHHTVRKFEIINKDAAFIVDEEGMKLVPHLVEKVEK